MQEPNLVLFIVRIASAAALLIWSVRLVRTGVERAFVVQLRQWLRRSARSRFLAAATGVASAVLLQSSTAVAILVTGFVSSGAVAAAVGLAILLGADIGSAVVAKMLLLRLSILESLLLLLGVGLFMRSSSQRLRQTGRILIGLALIFISLDMIRAATAPLVDSTGAAAVMQYLARDILTAFLIGAAFAWVVHSSVAAVLLFVTLVAQGLLPQSAAVAMVLGANLGGSMIAYLLTYSAPIEARRIVVSNLAIRGGGAALALSSLTLAAPSLAWLGATDAAVVINLHLAFNVIVTLAALPFLKPMMRLAEATMPQRPDPATGTGPISALDTAALAHPDRALSCAAREIMHMGEITETMLRSGEAIYHSWDKENADSILKRAAQVRSMHFELKLYLARLHHAELDKSTVDRSLHLSTVAVNIDGAADMIARNMVHLARRLNDEGLSFSQQGKDEISNFFDRVQANAQLALSVMMTANPAEARQLVAQKEDVRTIEQDLQRKHLRRLQQGRAESIETSNIHQETLRALKFVNTAFSMVAHPILLESGDLLDSRLTERV
ncbi:Na/Pi cotransporter family protein [Loktanella sp. DJP18]|uniref:Na/Pi cotransporter family protein n=1 Tax=Loktanella sp. DJP18 TaxID=3409788 RepID=UPI003BB5EEF9